MRIRLELCGNIHYNSNDKLLIWVDEYKFNCVQDFIQYLQSTYTNAPIDLYIGDYYLLPESIFSQLIQEGDIIKVKPKESKASIKRKAPDCPIETLKQNNEESSSSDSSISEEHKTIAKKPQQVAKPTIKKNEPVANKPKQIKKISSSDDSSSESEEEIKTVTNPLKLNIKSPIEQFNATQCGYKKTLAQQPKKKEAKKKEKPKAPAIKIPPKEKPHNDPVKIIEPIVEAKPTIPLKATEEKCFEEIKYSITDKVNSESLKKDIKENDQILISLLMLNEDKAEPGVDGPHLATVLRIEEKDPWEKSMLTGKYIEGTQFTIPLNEIAYIAKQTQKKEKPEEEKKDDKPHANYEELHKQTIQNSIKKQIEYYFGEKNFSQDTYLQSCSDNDGYISMEVIMKFNRIRAFTDSIDEIRQAVRASNAVELSQDENKIRRKLKT